MRKIHVLSIIVCLSLSAIAGCGEKDELKADKRFLVDKIYNYNNDLIGEYFYDEKNRLTELRAYDPVNDRSYDYQLEYSDGTVTVKFNDHDMPQFSHDIIIYYDDRGWITHDIVVQPGYPDIHREYPHYPDGRIKGLLDNEKEEYCTFYYDGTPNVVRNKIRYTDSYTGEQREREAYFMYDNESKPDFGTGNIFQFEAMPYFGSEASLEKGLSGNNMTESIESNGDWISRWIHTYNRYGLPETIELKWNGIEILEPVMWRMHYKEVSR